MAENMLFWGVALGIVLGCLLLVFAPLLRGRARAARRASYDMQIYRDQLREVDADRARGVLSQDEAEATRAEVSRRLLAAADAEKAETGAAGAPRRLSALGGVAAIVVLSAATAGLYATLGAPGLRDQPLELRMARLAEARANRPSQAEVEQLIAEQDAPVVLAPEAEADAVTEVEALVAQMDDLLARRPDDLVGHRLLASSLAGLGRWPPAAKAQGRVVELRGSDATAQDLVVWAEYMILAANGYVSPEAEAALDRAVALEPTNPLGMYYSGRALLQGGEPEGAYRLWSALLDRGPPDAPWIAAIEADIDAAAQMAGLAPRRAAPGPSAADVEAAGEMSGEDRAAMIEGMVAQLSDRLAREGGPAEDWARLIRALGVLGRREQAGAIAMEAQGVFAADPGARELIRLAARDAGVVQ